MNYLIWNSYLYSYFDRTFFLNIFIMNKLRMIIKNRACKVSITIKEPSGPTTTVLKTFNKY